MNNKIKIGLAILTSIVLFGCSKDDDSCNCVKETYSREIEHLYDTQSEESKCMNETNELRIDEFGTLYRYTCK